MGKRISVSVKALVIGGLCAILLGLVVVRQLRVERLSRVAFESIGSYIGACQEAGVLPSPEQLAQRLKALEAQAQAKVEPEKK